VTPRRTHSLRVASRGPWNARVELDGLDVSNAVESVAVTYRFGESPTAVLKLAGLPDAQAAAEDTEIVLPDETRALLVALGWTPPEA
jgi:hypothetical protein